MLAGSDRLAVKHVDLANQFFLRPLFIYKTQCFRTFQRPAVSGHRFVKGKHAHSFARCLLRVFQSVLVFTGMNVVIREPLYSAAAWSAMTLQSFRRVAM